MTKKSRLYRVHGRYWCPKSTQSKNSYMSLRKELQKEQRELCTRNRWNSHEDRPLNDVANRVFAKNTVEYPPINLQNESTANLSVISLRTSLCRFEIGCDPRCNITPKRKQGLVSYDIGWSG